MICFHDGMMTMDGCMAGVAVAFLRGDLFDLAISECGSI